MGTVPDRSVLLVEEDYVQTNVFFKYIFHLFYSSWLLPRLELCLLIPVKEEDSSDDSMNTSGYISLLIPS